MFETFSVYCSGNLCARIRITKIYTLHIIHIYCIYPVPMIQCYIYKQYLAVGVKSSHRMYLLHFKEMLINPLEEGVTHVIKRKQQ